LKTSKLTLVILSLTLTAAFSVEAKTKTKTVKSKVVSQHSNNKLSTDVKFDGQLVGGQIQSPFESLTVVENEKSIDDLIGVRQNFTDRNDKSKGMR
jgi:hypothetical protein